MSRDRYERKHRRTVNHPEAVAMESGPARIHTPSVKDVLYCLGFLFTRERDAVVLIEKQRPAWQKGRYNGIGGHVEVGETPLFAMAREGKEEAALPLTLAWEHFAVMAGADWGCVCYRAFDTEWAARAHADVSADGDGGERIELIRLDGLPAKPLLPNLSWLIPLALDPEPQGVAEIRYASAHRSVAPPSAVAEPSHD